jgi:hypothetical protein
MHARAGIDPDICIHDEPCTQVTPVCDMTRSMSVLYIATELARGPAATRAPARAVGTTYRRGSSPMLAAGRTDGFIGGAGAL